MKARRMLDGLLEDNAPALGSQVTARNGMKGVVTLVGAASPQSMYKLRADHRALLSGTIQVKWSDGSTTVVPTASVGIAPPATTPPPLPAGATAATATPPAATPTPATPPAASAPSSLPGTTTVFGKPQPQPPPFSLTNLAQMLVNTSSGLLAKAQTIQNDPALQDEIQNLADDLADALRRLP